MAQQWQIRRGTNSENNEFTGAAGEVTMDTDRKELRLHDGSTQGGTIIGRNYKSNCITEIPQNIKLEASDNILKIKAGSTIYIPNGVGVFDEYTYPSDVTLNIGAGVTSKLIVFINANTKNLAAQAENCFYSGDNPTISTSIAIWYDTTENKIKFSDDSGSTWRSPYAFPIAKITTNNGTISSIDQIFNGFGYIGSTVFVLPGVKGLIPDGRNTDGTLKNKEFILSNIIVNSAPGTGNRVLILNPTDNGTLGRISDAVYISNTKPTIISTAQQQYWFNPAENIIYKTLNAGTSWAPNDTIFAGTYILNTIFDSFNPKTTFHAVDYSEADFVVAFQRPTSANNYTWYRKYKSGWVEQGGENVNATKDYQVTLPIPMSNSHYTVTLGGKSFGNNNNGFILNIKSDSMSSTGFKMQGRDYNNGDYTQVGWWRVEGMAA